MIPENFNSIDKLVEFGMSAAIATQMINTMNHSLSTMAIPGQMPPTGQVQIEYYVIIDGNQAGPLSDSDLTRLIEIDKLTPETLIWCRGMTGWMQAAAVPAVNKFFLLAGRM